MATIVLRSVKGSPLTNAEVDANFSNINTELGQKLTGNQTITISGDASGSGTTGISLTLASVGTAGTYTKVTVDSKGRVTLGAALASSDVTTALGFTPYNATNPSGYITSSASITGASRFVDFLDNRSVNDQPQGKQGYRLSADFKDNSAVGSPPVTANASYSHILTLAGWDTIGGSGGFPSQLSVGDGIAVRQATNATTWGAWRTLLHSNNFGSYALPLSGGTLTGALTTASGSAILIGGQSVTTSARLTIDWHTTGDSQYSIGKRAGAWTQPMDISFYTGLRYHAHQSYGGHRFFTGGYDSTEAFSVGNGDSNVRVVNTLFIGGNTALHAANYSSYALPLSGGTLTGNLQLGSQTNRHLSWYTNTNWVYYLGGEGNNLRLYDADNTSFMHLYYGSGGSTKMVELLGSALRVQNDGSVTSGGKRIADAWLHSDRDFADGTLITTDINYAVTSGDPWVLEISGYPYGEVIPFDIKVNGYIYYDTIINFGGLSNGLNITGLVALNVGGNLCFWFPRQSYWHGYYVRAYVPYSGYPRNRVTSITSTAKPSGTKEVALSSSIRQSLHSTNFNSYAPTLTGTGASGTWGISISGSAAQLNGYASAENGASVVLRTASNGYLYLYNWINVGSGGLFSDVNGAHLLPSDSTYGSWRISGSKNGYTGISTVGTSHRINWMVDLGGNLQGWYNESYGWQMYWSSGTLTVFKNAYGGGTAAAVLDSANYTSYAPSLTGSGASGSWNITAARATRANGNFYIDDNYGNSLVGAYASTRYQGVFAMGDAYKLPADGTTAGNLYGIAWSYPSAGGVAGNLDSHGMLVLINGGFGSCMSYSIVASGNVTAYSDERLKTNWRSMPENFVERLAAVKVGVYDRKDGERISQVGVSAQSLQALLPEAITTAKDEMGTLSVSYGNAAMASAVELAKEIVALKRELAALKSKLH